MVIEGTGMTLIERSEVLVTPTLSVTRKVIGEEAVTAAGIPEIAPLAGLRPSPAGSVPETIDQV